MPIPPSIGDISPTPGSNSPSGSESPATFDDYMRTIFAFIAQLRDGKVDLGNAVLLTGAQTIAGAKTFSDGVIGNLTGNVSGNVTGNASGLSTTLAIASGGTGQTSAANAFNALKQQASETATGVIEIATAAEALAGTDTVRAITPSGLRSGLGASGSAPIFAARAWANIAGTTGAVRASGNVSSVTRNGTGDYTVNFSTAMPDTSYAFIPGGRQNTPNYSAIQEDAQTARTASAIRISSLSQNSGAPTPFDADVISFAVFR